MEEVINKPENQFKDILNDLIDYDKNSEEKSALIEEVCRKASKQLTKPAASLNSSIYSSAASSSSSASDSSTNSASSSSTSSTLSSPSQSNQSNGETREFRIIEVIEDYDNLEVPKMEDLGKTARILEHISGEQTTANDISLLAAASHSDKRSTSIYNNSHRLSSSSSLVSQTPTYKLTQLNQQANLIQHSIDTTNHILINNSDLAEKGTSANSWKTISGKRDKRRRKPLEQPVLSQHIPGHKGEQEVDWLVQFIESGSGAANTNNNSKKGNNKSAKPQPKRQAAQNTDLDRENIQRKPSSNNNKPASTQSRPLLLQSKPIAGNNQIAPMSQTQQSDQRKVQPPLNNILSQPGKQKSSSLERYIGRTSDPKEPNHKPEISHAKRSSQPKQSSSSEAAVTFADHIRVSDDDVGERYTFGFFEEPRQQTNSHVKAYKSTTKHNEKSITSYNKTSQVSQKHKMKHPKASLISEQKRYKCNDNIDANSFNYHQILEFISDSWESTAKSHRLIVKQGA